MSLGKTEQSGKIVKPSGMRHPKFTSCAILT